MRDWDDLQVGKQAKVVFGRTKLYRNQTKELHLVHARRFSGLDDAGLLLIRPEALNVPHRRDSGRQLLGKDLRFTQSIVPTRRGCLNVHRRQTIIIRRLAILRLFQIHRQPLHSPVNSPNLAENLSYPRLPAQSPNFVHVGK